MRARSRHLLTRSAIPLVLAMAAPMPAFAQVAPERPPQAATRINLPLIFSGSYLGDIAAEVTDGDRFSVNYDDFVRLMGDRLKPETKAKIAAPEAAGGMVPATILNEAGVKVEYNPETLEIHASIPLKEQGARSIEVVSGPEIDSTKFDQPAAFSGSSILSLSQAVSHDNGLFSTFEPVKVANQTAFNLGGENGFNLFAETYYDGSERRRFRRGAITLTHENRDTAMRYLAGDISPTTTGFQGGAPIGGIGIEKNYSELQPYRNVRPAGLFKFALEQAATVEILVNGAPTRAYRLERGQYDVRDFNFASGLNKIEIYVVDDYGRRLIASFSQFFNFNLLDPGLSEFGFYAGVPQLRNDDGLITYSGSPTVTGYYRRGITQTLTAGADFQADKHQAMAGVSAGWASKFGTFALAAAMSRDEVAGMGHQLLLSYQIGGSGFGPIYNPTVDVEVGTKSKNFVALGDIPGSDLSKFDLRSRISASVFKRFGIGLFGLVTTRRADRPALYSYGASVSVQLAGFSVSANVERSRTDEGAASRFFITFGRSLGPRRNSRSSYDSRAGTAQFELSRFRDNSLSDFGYRAVFSRGHDGLDGSGELTYNANRAFLAVRHDVTADRNGSNIEQRSSYSIATELAFAGGRFALGRPVGSNFLLAYPHRTLDSDVLVTQGIEDEKIIARSGWFGPALAPAGGPHAPRKVTLRAVDLPDGYDPGKSYYELMPGPATGYLAQVGSDENRTVQGNLVGADGTPVGLAVGSVEWLDKPKKTKTQIFTNKAGRFVATGLAPGRYRIRIGPDDLTTDIVVPESREGIVEVGRVVAKAGKEQ